MKIKDFFMFLILLGILAIIVIYQEPIVKFIVDKAPFYEGVIIIEPNEYALNYDFQYIKITDDFEANNYNEILNIFYTGLNYGSDTFDFYCKYDDCVIDVQNLIKDSNLSSINNFVHPYNSFRKIHVAINTLNKITIQVEHGYHNQTIKTIEEKLDKIKSEIITSNMTDKDKIKAFHDYIINNTKYDSLYTESNINDIDSPSHKALGPLFYGKALCGGYTDVMSIFLNQLGIPNYRISSEYHVWNLLKLDNTWYHLDLTWDDPVTSDHSDMLLDTFFLIQSDELKSLNTGYHDFNQNIFIEAN